jgi:HAMP domain-containing protein
LKTFSGQAPCYRASGRFDRVCQFFLGVILFFLVVGLVVSQGRAQSASGPGINPPRAASSAATAPEEDIRDIHGPISIPYPWMWVVYVLAALGAAALAWALWRWYKNRQQARAKLPHEIALEALERARALMRVDSVRAYSFAVSEAVRNYIEVRFDARAANRTTEEFLYDLVHRSSSPLAAHSPLLEQFLKNCDLVKFARQALTVPEMETMHTSAQNFILATRPQPEPEAGKKVRAEALPA